MAEKTEQLHTLLDKIEVELVGYVDIITDGPASASKTEYAEVWALTARSLVHEIRAYNKQ